MDYITTQGVLGFNGELTRMKSILALVLFFVTSVAFAAFPPCDSQGKPWREGNKTYYCSKPGAGNGNWVEVDTDNHENVTRYGAICDSATDSAAAFTAADAAATASGKRVYIPSCLSGLDYLVDADVTFVNPVEFASDALLNIQAGDTVTFNNKSFTAPSEQIFSGEVENVVFGEAQTVNSRWWGYSASDGNINRRAIQSAIDSIPSGTVRITGEWLVAKDGSLDDTIFPIIRLKSAVNIEGESRQSSILKIPDSHGQYSAILGNQISQNPSVNVNNVKITNITFDHNYTNNTDNSIDDTAYFSHTRSSVYVYGGDNVTFDNNRVTDADSIVCVYYVGDATGTVGKEFSNGYVLNSEFDNIGDLPEHYDHSTMNVQGSNIVVRNNTIVSGFDFSNSGSAIETHASDCLVTENTLVGMYSGVTVTGIDAYGDNENIIVSNNNMNVRLVGVAVFSQQKNDHTSGYGIDRLVIENNNMYIDYDSGFIPTDEFRSPAGVTDSPSADTLPMRNVVISNNIIDFNVETKSADAWILLSNTAGISFAGGDNTVLRENFKITNNTITDAPLSGIVFNSTAMKNVDINSNTIVNWASAQFTTAADINKVGIKLDSIYNVGQIDIANNVMIDDRAVSLVRYQYYLTESDTGTDGLVDFKDNTLQVLDLTPITFVSNFYAAGDNTILPYVKERGNLIVLPTFSFRAGSELYDLSTNSRQFLGTDGTTWNNVTYTASSLDLDVAGGLVTMSDNTTLLYTLDSVGLTYETDTRIKAGTLDGSDTAELFLAGGGDIGITRGGSVRVSGNEDASFPGSVTIVTGDTASADIVMTATDNIEMSASGEVSSTSAINFGGGSLEIPNGTTIPATCNVGEQFIDTDSNDCIDTAAGDGALCVCKTANTWALISDF